jgi:hypothetical protein
MPGFIQAMNAPSLTKTGVNGSHVYTEEGVGHPLVSFSTMLVRGLSDTYIQKAVKTVMDSGDKDMIRDLWVLAFHTRDIRGGKGERDLFYTTVMYLLKSLPQDVSTLMQIVELIPQFGCWRDLWTLHQDSTTSAALKDAIRIVTQLQLQKDEQHMAEEKPASLLAKWLPREGSKTYKGLAAEFATVWGNQADRTYCLAKYRRRISALNKYLKTVEINMCGGTWQEIQPGSVPGKNLKLHTKAFLNETCKYRRRTGSRIMIDDEELRYPDNEDRMQCRENFQTHLKKVVEGAATVKGAHTVMPHELVIALRGEKDEHTDTAHMIQAQWESIRRDILEKGTGQLRRIVPMSDVSSSMEGIPMEVSIALGILLSEVNHHAFRDHVMTFHTTPSWIRLPAGGSLFVKDSKLREAPWGGSTNFKGAMDLILRRMVEHRVPVGEEPDDLLILTDMGFDAACGSTNTQTLLQSFQESFVREGEKLWGVGNGWKMPRIILWNLRDQYKDFHAQATTKGVMMVAGWSPAILAALQSPVGITAQTPLECLRATLDAERYGCVREVLDRILR